jgi:hypothetical protein
METMSMPDSFLHKQAIIIQCLNARQYLARNNKPSSFMMHPVLSSQHCQNNGRQMPWCFSSCSQGTKNVKGRRSDKCDKLNGNKNW